MVDTKEKTVEYLPFHAVNEFMRDDYRFAVIAEVMQHLDSVPSANRKEITQEISRNVKISGFRNSNQAPVTIKAKQSAGLFQKSARYSAAIINAWSSLHPDLASTVWTVLSEHGWEPLPLEANREKLPGYQVKWPKSDTFEVLQQAVRNVNASLTETDDDISLMAVWVGNRLPYDLFIEAEEEKSS
jgi:hypothetical protein